MIRGTAIILCVDVRIQPCCEGGSAVEIAKSAGICGLGGDIRVVTKGDGKCCDSGRVALREKGGRFVCHHYL